MKSKNPLKNVVDHLASLQARRAEVAQQLEQQKAAAPERVLAEIDAQLTAAQATAAAEHEAAKAARVIELQAALRAAGEELAQFAEAQAAEMPAKQAPVLALYFELRALGAWADPQAVPFLPDMGAALQAWRDRKREAEVQAWQRENADQITFDELQASLKLAVERYKAIDKEHGSHPLRSNLEITIAQIAGNLQRLTGEWPKGLPIKQMRSEQPKPATALVDDDGKPRALTLAELDAIDLATP